MKGAFRLLLLPFLILLALLSTVVIVFCRVTGALINTSVAMAEQAITGNKDIKFNDFFDKISEAFNMELILEVWKKWLLIDDETEQESKDSSKKIAEFLKYLFGGKNILKDVSKNSEDKNVKLKIEEETEKEKKEETEKKLLSNITKNRELKDLVGPIDSLENLAKLMNDDKLFEDFKGKMSKLGNDLASSPDNLNFGDGLIEKYHVVINHLLDCEKNPTNSYDQNNEEVKKIYGSLVGLQKELSLTSSTKRPSAKPSEPSAEPLDMEALLKGAIPSN